jgi:diguanylate cyclase (GGDEF)-like protein/PAS domain S-box-containing protein
MTDYPAPTTQPDVDSPAGIGTGAAEERLSEVRALLAELQRVASTHEVLPPVVSRTVDDRLVRMRLGMASSLFVALQCKHAATAGHVLRVALNCSAWARKRQLDAEHRDAIELAALLHDVGVIGVPDRILLKPGVLDNDEAALMARSRHLSLEILRQSCTDPRILEIVEHVPAWFDGSRKDFPCRGEAIPLGARMIAVAEAFDAMTTDHVYRPAMPLERAMTELFDCSGSQFDPELVAEFTELLGDDPSRLHAEVAGRWLRTLDPRLVDSCWSLNCVPSEARRPQGEALFQSKLLENMHDAVVFVDAGGRITLWNRGAERLTGIAESGVRQRPWQPDLLDVTDERAHPVTEADCPVQSALRSGVQSLRRLTIRGRGGRPVAVDAHTIPVLQDDGTMLGAILLFHDASSETSLEKRCQSLYDKATRDPLTQVANRAEFDRVYETFLAAHQQRQMPCSLLMCDLDRFKQVNDTYGHQAGDDVIRSLASLLKSSCRPGDLVARYGGEEFVVLCADCDNAAAARRADQIRAGLSQVPQTRMGGRSVTVSFGVTGLQPGDTSETMLRRADRALLAAKTRGRNNVVQLGSGSVGEEESKGLASFWSRKPAGPSQLIEKSLVTPVPVKMAVEKLRGFVADHQAKVVTIDGDQVRIEIDDTQAGRLRRFTDRPVTFQMDVKLAEERTSRESGPGSGEGVTRTRIQVSVKLRKHRDRRRTDLNDRARQVLASFKAYLMANELEESETTNPSALGRAKRILAPWLNRKQ